MRRFIVGLLLAAKAWGFAPGELSAMEPMKFWLLPALQERIDVAQLDRELIAAAIFHETNRTRTSLGLPAFKYSPALDRAADFQASVGSLLNAVSHDNPLPDLATLKQRVQKAGLKLQVAAENIAATTVLEGPTGPRSVIVQKIAGREVLLDPETRQPVLPRTYADMASSVVRQWMNSPGHRENMVSTELHFLGVSVRPRKNPAGMDSLYSVQVFFTPQAELAAPPERKTPRRTFSPTSGSAGESYDNRARYFRGRLAPSTHSPSTK